MCVGATAAWYEHLPLLLAPYLIIEEFLKLLQSPFLNKMRTEILSLRVIGEGDATCKFPYMYLVCSIIHIIDMPLAIIFCFSLYKSLAGTRINTFPEYKIVLGAYYFTD